MLTLLVFVLIFGIIALAWKRTKATIIKPIPFLCLHGNGARRARWHATRQARGLT